MLGAAAPARGAGKARRLVGQGLLQVRGRRAVRGDQEVRGEDRRQGRAVAVRGAGHDPEDGGRARCRHAARRRLCRRLRLPGRRQVGRTKASSRTSPTSSTPIKGKLPAEHASRRRFLYNDKTKKRAYYAFPIKQQTMHIQYWKDMLAEAGFKESRHPDRPGRTTGASGATRCSPATARRPASAPSASASRWAWTRATRSTRS